MVAIRQRVDKKVPLVAPRCPLLWGLHEVSVQRLRWLPRVRNAVLVLCDRRATSSPLRKNVVWLPQHTHHPKRENIMTTTTTTPRGAATSPEEAREPPARFPDWTKPGADNRPPFIEAGEEEMGPPTTS
jgi:hypothetical protein